VRLVGPAGEQVGIVSIDDALRLAQEADLDLVEVAPTARPPVCKLMDYGKFKYESALKARESRKNQAQTVIKEIKLRPKIDPHDYGTKRGHVERFLKAGDKVKVTIMFRGREQSRPELGFRLLQRLAGDVEELGFVEAQPKQDGRNMTMVIGPHRRKSDAKAERAPQGERSQGERSHSARSQGERPPAAPRSQGERSPAAPRSQGERSPDAPRAQGERSPDAPRSQGERSPDAPRAQGERSPDAPRPQGERSPAERPAPPPVPRPQGQPAAARPAPPPARPVSGPRAVAAASRRAAASSGQRQPGQEVSAG